MGPDCQLVTLLLHQWKNGDAKALDQLMPLIYQELRRLAGKCLSAERPDHTLRATELVHEAYMRLIVAQIDWQDRGHFYAIAARMIRRILVDHANSRNCQKRGRGVERVPLDESVVIGAEAPDIILNLDNAPCNGLLWLILEKAILRRRRLPMEFVWRNRDVPGNHRLRWAKACLA